MATRLYTLTIPLRLAVEADSVAAGRLALLDLYTAVMADLPVGAGCFMKDDEWKERTRNLAPA